MHSWSYIWIQWALCKVNSLIVHVQTSSSDLLNINLQVFNICMLFCWASCSEVMVDSTPREYRWNNSFKWGSDWGQYHSVMKLLKWKCCEQTSSVTIKFGPGSGLIFESTLSQCLSNEVRVLLTLVFLQYLNFDIIGHNSTFHITIFFFTSGCRT